METDSSKSCWVQFKYENLSRFCFGCVHLGHILRDCQDTPCEVKELPEDDLPFSLALKVKSNMVGKVYRKLGGKKMMMQCAYLGEEEVDDKLLRSIVRYTPFVLSIPNVHEKR